MEEVKVMVADESHIKYIDTILTTIAEAAKKRGSGIAKRSTEYVATKMREAKAVIALQGEKFAGFSYIETWGNKHYVTTSGLIVHPDFRGIGLAKRIKNLTFTLACPTAMASCQDFLFDIRFCRDEDEYSVGLSACYLCRLDRRRVILAWL